MLKINVKSWACDCGYYQDFEPTAELMGLHGLGSDDTCPSCHDGKLKKGKKGRLVMNIAQEGDFSDKEKKERKIKYLTDEETKELKDKHEDK